MNSQVRKRVIKKPVILLIMLTICGLAFFSGSKAFASTVGNNVTATDSTNNTKDKTDSNTGGNSAAANNKSSIDGSLGPIQFNLDAGKGSNSISAALQMLLVLTVISLAPSILIMVTSFTRIIIVLHFTRTALGLQTTPPNQVLVGLALILTFFIMNPVFSKINTDAIQPLSKGEITQEEALDAGTAPLRTFMLKQIYNKKDLKLFMDIANISSDDVKSSDDIPITVIIPSFIISELRTAFIIGFLIYIPFIVIDMVVASTLMSMGMMMLPPTMISMPFKILLFIIADGWNLIIGQLVRTFY